ncbi:MAG: hypothetical protein HC797_06385 [Anaerolineales bacterium]|nr:hypothetical protein [Anaerolineales bacterium]
MQAILIEISTPGGWVAGFIGAVCLTLATYGLGVLPINWFGIIFLIIAFVLFILDIKAPTHGALTAAGVASFIVGGLVLFNSPGTPEFQRVSVPLVVGTGIFFGLIFLQYWCLLCKPCGMRFKREVRVWLGKQEQLEVSKRDGASAS